MKILLIEDDTKISNLIQKAFKEVLCTVDFAYTAKDGLYLAIIHTYDVIILDWMLPDNDGLHVIKKIRSENIFTPILMLTAKGDLGDRVLGLEQGADDYMSKPFYYLELLTRVKALHRRNKQQVIQYLFTADLKVEPTKREVVRGNKSIILSAKEFKLLEYLLEYKGKVLTHTMILEHIWNIDDINQSNVVNVTIYHLRQKIDKGFDTTLIETIRGAGYRIKNV